MSLHDSPQLTFKPLEQSHLDLLCKWMNKPHVKEWWNDGLTCLQIKEKYQRRVGGATILPFIVYLDKRPIGFIQYYFADKVDDVPWIHEREGVVGIDQFIGEEDLINQGLGTQMIKGFIEKLAVKASIKKIITEVDPRNLRAQRCYEKVGFSFAKEVITPDGPAYLMEIEINNEPI